MKFMRLGSRPDTFFATESLRSVSSEIPTDIAIQVDNTAFLLHKFPLLSKCAHLKCLHQDSPASPSTIDLPDFPGGADAFELCAKFCYGVTITLSALNIVAARCAAEYLQMTDDLDRGNLVGKIKAFFNSCVLRRWGDSLVALQGTRRLPLWSEELGITTSCIDAVSAMIAAYPSKIEWYQSSEKNRRWWAEDISELGMDHYWRVIVAAKSTGRLPGKLVGEALGIYARRWLPRVEDSDEVTATDRVVLEKLVSLLPMEKNSTSCGFVLTLLKSATFLNASASTKAELARRAGLQLEEAAVSDLLIPLMSDSDEMIYDVDVVIGLLREFMLQGQSPPTSPKQGRLPEFERRRRSRSAENVDFEGQEFSSRRSSSAARHSSKLKVAKLIDGYLQEIVKDANLPMEKLVAVAEMVPEFARPDHDDLYRVIDIFLRAHPDLSKGDRKRLCRILDCKKLSAEACMHAAQNEMLPLRVVVQVLFLEQARAAAVSGGPVTELPPSIKALLAGAVPRNVVPRPSKLNSSECLEDDWSISSVRCKNPSITTLRMKLAEDDSDVDDDDNDEEAEEERLHRSGLMRSSSSRFKALCAIPNKPMRMLSRLWTLNRSGRERN